MGGREPQRFDPRGRCCRQANDAGLSRRMAGAGTCSAKPPPLRKRRPPPVSLATPAADRPTTAAAGGSEDSIAIVGGGLAGLAAAVRLAEAGQGHRVTLYESRPRLGGRATSFEDRETGELIDNCQHVSLGCCTEFARFCRATGLDGEFTDESEMWFLTPDGRRSRLAAAPLPAPLHLAPSFLRFHFLSIGQRLRLARGVRALQATRPNGLEDRRFSDWLAEHRQPETVVRRFWEPVLVSALSESLDRVHTAAARKVIVDGLLATRGGWRMQLPRRPLGELYGDRLADWLAAHGVRLRLKTGLRAVERAGGTGDGFSLVLRDGTREPAAAVAMAVPFQRLAGLLGEGVRLPEVTGPLEEVEVAPISSVHFWFDRPITELRHAVLLDTLAQWVFNRTAIHEDRDPERFAYQVVISASREVQERPTEEIVAQVRRELGAVFPAAREAVAVHSRVVTEHAAVYSVRPGFERLRPTAATDVSGLVLAGDYVRTGWPATMEGAVRSGFQAAEGLLAEAATPRRR